MCESVGARHDNGDRETKAPGDGDGNPCWNNLSMRMRMVVGVYTYVLPNLGHQALSALAIYTH